MRAWPGLVVALGALALILRLGLRTEPKPLPAARVVPTRPSTVPLPDDLPPPVDRFYRKLYGDRVPVVDTAVIAGRGTMRVAGVTLAVRFRFTHECGHAYHHGIEATIFGRRLFTVDEVCVDGCARLDLPFGTADGPRTDQGANLALWAEAVWMPAVWVTDRRVRWEEIDERAAALLVPFGASEERFVARFDPGTGMLRSLESMRFKGETSELRTRWINEVVEWGEVDGRTVPRVTTVTWLDEGSPWARLTTDEVAYHVDLGDRMRPPARG